MDIDPFAVQDDNAPHDVSERSAASDDAERSSASPNAARHDRLDTYVASPVALLATLGGLCTVTDDDIVQAMQQARGDKRDHWSYYHARTLRRELAEATAAEPEAAGAGQPAAAQARHAPLVATRLGVLMGVAGRAGWHLHPDARSRLLS